MLTRRRGAWGRNEGGHAIIADFARYPIHPASDIPERMSISGVSQAVSHRTRRHRAHARDAESGALHPVCHPPRRQRVSRARLCRARGGQGHAYALRPAEGPPSPGRTADGGARAGQRPRACARAHGARDRTGARGRSRRSGRRRRGVRLRGAGRAPRHRPRGGGRAPAAGGFRRRRARALCGHAAGPGRNLGAAHPGAARGPWCGRRGPGFSAGGSGGVRPAHPGAGRDPRTHRRVRRGQRGGARGHALQRRHDGDRRAPALPLCWMRSATTTRAASTT